MNKIIEALIGLLILRFIGGRGRAFAKYRVANALARFAVRTWQDRQGKPPATMDRKELARQLKLNGNSLRKIR